MEKELVLKIEGAGQKYGPNVVLHDISMNVHKGEIIGLVGENGAGKSTLMKIIAGVEKPWKGTMELCGEKYAPNNTLEANRQGVGMVFQEQSVITNLTVAENIFLGREKRYKTYGFLNQNKMNKDARKVLDEFKIPQKPETKILNIDFASRQMIEIAKIFDITTEGDRNAVILLDEPTSVLSAAEVKILFEHMNVIKQKGHSIIFISHRLDEVQEIADTVYVFKDGANTAILDKSEANKAVLYEKMVGRSTTGEYFKENRQHTGKGDVILEVKDLSMYGYFRNVSLTLRKGDVLGICGLEGSGKEEVCGVISGDVKATSGEIRLCDKGGELHRVCFNRPIEARRKGILAVPKERNREGIISLMSIKDNIILSNMQGCSKGGVITGKVLNGIASEWVEKLDIKCASVNSLASELSGGNAQKVVFARAMFSNVDIYILNHPTRGVDVGAKEDIYSLIRDLTDNGGSVVLLGDTLDECIGLASKIIVMKDGMVRKEFDANVGSKPSQLDVVQYMM